jgi:uncharacterized repeat protein (TIGR01451 family)
MTGRTWRIGAVCVALCAAVVGVRGDDGIGRPFVSLQAGFTQELFGVSESFLVDDTGSLGGVATLPNGDVVAAECVNTGTRLHRFNTNAHYEKEGSELHVETILPSGGGCGLVYHPDGTLYLNTKDSGPGITNVKADTGAVIRRLGPQGNAVGIAVDPRTKHIVYTGSSCASNSGCTIHDLDPVTGAVATFAAFPATPAMPVPPVQYVNGIYFDPTGNYLFLDNRTPVNRLTVLDRTGAIVQHIAMPSSSSQPVGIGFAATSPKFVVTNNIDGTMQRFDFPSDDFTRAPARTVFASGGYRGDQMQAGSDGCLYVTQGGARYAEDDDDGTKANSIVRICGSSVQFVPPPGIPFNPPQGTLSGVVTDGLTGAPLAAAAVALSNGVTLSTDAAGAYAVVLAPGTYDAKVTAINYVTWNAFNVAIANGGTTRRNFALMPDPGTLAGAVTDAAGRPVVNATVLLTNGKSGKTDPAGRYSISVLPGTYGATASAATFYDTRTATDIAIASNATTTEDFTLTPMPGTVKGVVTGTGGAKLAGATVTLSSAAGPGIAPASTDANGAYLFADVAPGTYQVTAAAGGYDPRTSSGVAVPNAGTITVNVALSALSGTLRGVVRNAVTGAGVSGATVRVSSTLSTVTDGVGDYSLSLAAGTYTASASASNFTTDTAPDLAIVTSAVTMRNFSITPLRPDIVVAAAAPATVTAGTALSYTFTAINTGALAANAVAVTHVLPAQTSFTSVAAPSGWTCAKPAAGGSGAVSCSKPAMAINESATITVNVVVACPFTGTTLTMAVSATSTTAEGNMANNTASAVTTVKSPVPVISGAAVDTLELWPPNHKMVDVKVAYTVTGLTCSTAKTKLTVAGNDGAASDDFEIVDAHRIKLRSERSGNTASRVYTITITATGDDKVVTKQTLTVTVPHDQGNNKGSSKK